ncbi:MAG: bacteriohemerythrin [Aromatoleum sp.]|jgi:hemerythrin|uniref:bacteriohemerythrin n=1 Tax=Aromatoleum sp. TaxID=2307007 RepID=UPI002895E001|nr:bacteriohemerythrin [Aromatoleum sp.]MDT3671551.1 bacteriohemerythrin [Aromatoleum sp.]
MSRFEWKAEYSVDDAILDDQHRQMLAILDELADALDGNAAPESGGARAVFDDLAAYVTGHLAYEEQRIADAGYPEDRIVAHRQEHNALLRKVQEFERVFEQGGAEVLEELMPFLYGDWLIHHICETDREYVPYLKTAR